MDITAFKVSHPVGIDKDATALRAARARSSSIGVCEKGGDGVQPMLHRGDGTLHMWGLIRGKAHPLPRNAQSNGQRFSGAMDEMSQKGSKRQTLCTAYPPVMFNPISWTAPPYSI